MLPAELAEEYTCLDSSDNEYESTVVKAADKISAYFKCIEELKSGNREFATAKETLLSQIEKYKLPEVDYFMEMWKIIKTNIIIVEEMYERRQESEDITTFKDDLEKILASDKNEKIENVLFSNLLKLRKKQ